MKYRSIPREHKEYSLIIENSESIAAGSNYDFNIDERFTPYDFLEISNLNTDNDATIIVNYSQKYPLPAGTSTEIKGKIQNLKIKNIGSSAINSSEIKGSLLHFSKKQNQINALASISQILNFLK